MLKQQLMWNRKFMTLKKMKTDWPLLSKKARKQVSLPLLLPFCFCVSVSLCFSPAVTDLNQLQLKQKKNEVDVQKEAQQPSALMSPLQLEHQKSLAAGPGSAHIRQLL